ncbi:PTS lactose/cellobiose transporter subunit IIA [Photobacterium nomapromontoriensis]|uniref:PTS lactose/cellobiose transporter subunit IIA n=1 Tax=Photobacterium nomapromontoriensis TaxID=2910237 RepID=UPI003D13329A
MDIEQTIMELLVAAGNARSTSLMAIQAARKHDFEQAQALIEEAKAAINQAHKVQTALIGMDEGEGKLQVTLIVVHAQDHLMNAMVIQDLAQDLIELYRRTSDL